MGRFNSEQKRKIVEAAAGVFAEHGSHGATTRLVARQAGVNSALIYYYFENKDALLVECTRFALSEFLESLGMRRHTFPGARDRLHFLVNGIFDYWAAHPDRFRLIIMILTLHPDRFGLALKNVLGDQAPVPLEVLQEGIANGELKPMHPLHAWWSIMVQPAGPRTGAPLERSTPSSPLSPAGNGPAPGGNRGSAAQRLAPATATAGSRQIRPFTREKDKAQITADYTD